MVRLLHNIGGWKKKEKHMNGLSGLTWVLRAHALELVLNWWSFSRSKHLASSTYLREKKELLKHYLAMVHWENGQIEDLTLLLLTRVEIKWINPLGALRLRMQMSLRLLYLKLPSLAGGVVCGALRCLHSLEQKLNPKKAETPLIYWRRPQNTLWWVIVCY